MPVLPRPVEARSPTVRRPGLVDAVAGADDRGVEDVAGYRVLRSAGHGDRAQLLIGFDDGQTAVLKVTPADDPRAGVEIEALHRAAGEHVVPLTDVSADETSTVLVLERLSNGTLAELLERRAGLDAGEAVTILAPIAATIDRIHRAGVAHGGLSVASVCFRDDGAPLLTGFGDARLFDADSPEVVLETVPGVLADREALRGIVALVLARVVGGRAAAARKLATTIDGAAPAEIAAGLFGLAAATPVRFGDDEGDLAGARLVQPREPEPVGEGGTDRLPPWLTGLLPEWIRERIEEPVAQVAAVWSGWHPRRRRLVLGGLAGGLTVLVAVAAVPAPSDGPAAPVATTPADLALDDEVSALPDDPVEAAVVLLDSRERCMRDLSLLCLDDVVQPGSAAQADDMAMIRAVQAGGEFSSGEIVAGMPILVERLGDAALLDLPPGSTPVSVLLMKTELGWRIRDYLDTPAVSD